jgi:hypothetical protein
MSLSDIYDVFQPIHFQSFFTFNSQLGRISEKIKCPEYTDNKKTIVYGEHFLRYVVVF